MLTLDELWEKLVSGDESTQIEAKRGEDVGKSIFESISAFANEPNNGGGYFLLGVGTTEDALFPDYRIVGVSDPDKVQTTLATVCRNSIEPPVRPSLWSETREGKTVVIAYIPEAQAHEKPVFVKSRGVHNGSYRRIGSSDQKCTDMDFEEFYQARTNKSFDSTAIGTSSVADVDSRALREYRRLRAEVNLAADELDFEDEELLDALSATVMDKGTRVLTVAGLLLFGKPSALRRELPMMRVDYMRVNGREWLSDPDRPYDDLLEYREPLLLMIPRIIGQIMEDMPRAPFLQSNSVQRKDNPLIPLRVIREAVVNALMHRNYRTHGAVQIIRFSNRLEIINPGHSLVPPERFGEPGATRPRNPKIANVIHEVNFAETKGTGIRRMRERMAEANLTLPILESDRHKDSFSTSLFTVHFIEESDVKWLANFKDCSLSEAEARSLLFVRKTGIIDNALYRILNQGLNMNEASRSLIRLRELDLIDSRSKGAATFYVAGKRLLEAEGMTPHLSITNPADKSLAVGFSLTDNVTVPGLPVHIAEAVESLGQRATPDEVKYVINKLCRWRALQVTELAGILKRSRRHIQEKYLRPMIRKGDLQYTYPDNPAHPHQAYRVAKKSKKRPNSRSDDSKTP